MARRTHEPSPWIISAEREMPHGHVPGCWGTSRAHGCTEVPKCCTSRLPSLSGLQVIGRCGAPSIWCMLLGGWSLLCSFWPSTSRSWQPPSHFGSWLAVWSLPCSLWPSVTRSGWSASHHAFSPLPWYLLPPPLLALRGLPCSLLFLFVPAWTVSRLLSVAFGSLT